MAPYFDRVARIQELCKGRRVLDVGCCNHGNLSKWEAGQFLHAEIAKTAGDLHGLDNDIEALEKLKERGFKVHEGNAEKLEAAALGQFDVVVAGEIIEHLSNPGLFMDGAYSLLNPGGVLVATVPNAWSFTRLKQLYKGLDDVQWTHSQHTAWYSKATIAALFRRHGFEPVELGFCDMYKSSRWLKTFRDRLRLGWAMKPEFSESVFIVGRKENPGT
jgi:2-polyprenyl-3-methyl-5-hydroxy-6-metoxy-1,4-benzoquinol methylase